MRTIYKQKLEICDCQTIEVPGDYKFIHIAEQHDEVYIWYECNILPGYTKKIDIHCFGTGHPMPSSGTPEGALRYIGTVITHNGAGVWHFYEDYGIKPL